jgi:fructose-1,6-bisphosphatase/inositol monophosphatase family enzyme
MLSGKVGPRGRANTPALVRAGVARQTAEELEILFRIAYAVRHAVRQTGASPRRGEVVAMGAAGSPTEELDRIAEAQIFSSLEEEGVDWNVLSEEAGFVKRGGSRVLVVDPVDGSHNALRGFPMSTVSLALGQSTLGDIEVGVVHNLDNGVTHWAKRGHGAFRDGHRLQTRTWEARTELFCVNLGRHSTPKAARLAEKGRRVRSLGCASLELAMVAQGSADAYFFENDNEGRNLRVTDIAAAYLIVREAGGGITDTTQRPLEPFPLSLDQRTSVFAWGDPSFAKHAVSEGYL